MSDQTPPDPLASLPASFSQFPSFFPQPNPSPNPDPNPDSNFHLQISFQGKRKRTGVRRKASQLPSLHLIPPPPSLAAPPLPGDSNSIKNLPENPDLAADISEEIIVINKEALTADSLTEEEIEAGVVSSIDGIEQVNYILIRNHILSKWCENVSNWLTKGIFSSLIPPHC